MQSRRPQDNLWYTVSLLILGFLKTLFQSIWYSILAIFGKTKSRLLEGNHFVRSLHFLFYEYPKSFWKKPTGIGMGRSIGTLVLYFLGKSKYFMDDSTKHPLSAKISKKGFTLLEMLLSITVFSVILILAFAAFGNISVSKQKILGDVDVYEQLYTALEQLSSTIKEGGDIDYEEYFNRRMLGTTLSGWHYSIKSGYGNYGQGWDISLDPPTGWSFWSSFYFCRSSPGEMLWGEGCYGTGALNSSNGTQNGVQQRYGQYRLQFIDYNKFGSDDAANCAARGAPGRQLGDQNCDGSIQGDEDDEDLGKGPESFTGGVGMPELYLIQKGQTNPVRTLFRLSIERDPDAPASATCDTSSGTGSGCIGRLQMRKLIGRDLWSLHGVGSTPVYDGQVDTWECLAGYPCTRDWFSGRKLPWVADTEWVNLFWSDIHVRSVAFFPSPSQDYTLAWKEWQSNLSNPFVRVSITLGYSWKKRKLLHLDGPEIHTTTTLNLTKK